MLLEALRDLHVLGLTLSAALHLPEAFGDRMVDVVGLWCGVWSIAAAVSVAGYALRKFDKSRVPGVKWCRGSLSAVCCVLRRLAVIMWVPVRCPLCALHA